MIRDEYMQQLGNFLRKLPKHELANAISYYNEYFDDAGSDDEEKVIDKLGSPIALASKILGEFALNTTNHKSYKQNFSALWRSAFSVLAAPVLLPAAAAGIVFLLAIFMVVLVVIAAMFFFGIWSAYFSTVCLFNSIHFLNSPNIFNVIQYGNLTTFTNMLVSIGLYILTFGLGLLLSLWSIWIARISMMYARRWVGKILLKRGTKA